jgi:tRNA A-37 threonylcarbamoyl transferase component Bud32
MTADDAGGARPRTGSTESISTSPAMDPEPMRLALRRLGLLQDGEEALLTPLAGGIASDIWKVDLPRRTVCIKRALPKLKVKADWFVPIERNLYEWLYYEIAETAAPGSAPGLVARDTEGYLFVMEYLPPDDYPLWKNQLRDGLADARLRRSVGERLAASTHTRGSTSLAERSPPTTSSTSRMEAYLEATARAHPDIKPVFCSLIETTMHTKHALVHGDVSPKNILNGPKGPVLLDAECAFYGDPAFDLAFCLNHLLLKCLWAPAARDGFLKCFAALKDRYLALVDWEAPGDMEARTARLLPGLFLARVDGKSPVEYITRYGERELVRKTARALLLRPVTRLAQVSAAWQIGRAHV